MSAAIPLQPDDLQSQATQARDKLAELDHAAREAERAAAKALADFEDRPTEKTHATKAIAEQRSKNATRDRDSYAEEIAPLLADATRQKARADLEQLQPRIRGMLPDATARVEDLLAELRRRLKGEMTELVAAITESNRMREQATRLASKSGYPQSFGRVTLENVVDDIERMLGGDPDPLLSGRVQFRLGGQPGKRTIHLELTCFIPDAGDE